MKSLRTTLLSIAAISTCAIAAAPAFAKDIKSGGVYAEPAYGDEIIIVAPEIYRRDTGRRTSSGIPEQELTLQRAVSAHDLNLRYDTDVAELQRRVRATAEDICDEIGRASSGGVITPERECVREATRDAMVQVDALVHSRRG
ncbi:MAG: UrcA family protein [Hyphomonadaceae bacterium]|nr:UrcA family protein [Hyphomonadaceae bacterium]